uniref:NADH-ubiquinone oxidoreductase chain 1 n=1 Tax=Anoplophora chinensis TaxID=217632 RepID=A0A0U2W556_ANOCN|nr:NADH dehydrogenase subunit 1 [Anoplophora chinensis]ALS54029.1 NADH dehydrogenase subunit 1 [Anoplophora chinensis]UNB14377.1 NADH dehydrogenase subunit 1 [Anoplophora chinensis]
MLLDLFLIFLSSLILIICVLVGVAFLTLLERKVLGYIQIRKGPNKVGFVGLIQPFSDAIKLFTKEQTYPYMSNLNLYYLSPIMNLFLALVLWMCIPFISVNVSFNLSMLYFLSVSSLSVYTVMLAGWSSNSNYSLLGSLRAVAQAISYEVSLSLILMSFLYLILSLNMLDLMKYQKFIWFSILMLPLCFMWLVSSLAETNRTPFDFAEGESELVSGFNVEYSSGGFAMIFLAEYASILFMSFICSMLFLGGNLMDLSFFLKVGFMSFLWIWVRGTLPRYRYDKLMYLSWKSYLPISLNYLLLFFGLKIFIFTLSL